MKRTVEAPVLVLLATLAASAAAFADPPAETFSEYLRFPQDEYILTERADPFGVPLGSDWRWGRGWFRTRSGTGYELLVSFHDSGNPGPDTGLFFQTHMAVQLIPDTGPFAGRLISVRCPRGEGDLDCSLHFDPPGSGYVHDFSRVQGTGEEAVSFQRIPGGDPLQHRYRIDFDYAGVVDSAWDEPESYRMRGSFVLVMDALSGNRPLQWHGNTRFFYQYEEIFPTFYARWLPDGLPHAYMYQQFGRIEEGTFAWQPVPGETPWAVEVVDHQVPSFMYLEKQPKSRVEPMLWLARHKGHDYISVQGEDGSAFSFVFDYVCEPSLTCAPEELTLPVSLTYRAPDGRSFRVPVMDDVGGVQPPGSEIEVRMTHLGMHDVSLLDPGIKVAGRFLPLEYEIRSEEPQVFFDPAGGGFFEVPAFHFATERMTPARVMRATHTAFVVGVHGSVRQAGGPWLPFEGFAAVEQTKAWDRPEDDPYGAGGR